MKKNMRLIKILGEEDYQVFERIFRVFEGEPFWEKWTDLMILEAFKEFLLTGKMFAYEDYGLMNIQFNKKKLDSLPYEKWGNFIYLSDVAVLTNSRKQGVGSELIDYLIEYGYENKFDSLYFRTNYQGSMLANIGIKKGFEILTDENNQIITEDVSFPRIKDDIAEVDTRQYLYRKLR